MKREKLLSTGSRTIRAQAQSSREQMDCAKYGGQELEWENGEAHE